MFANARNTVVTGGTFTMQGDSFHSHNVVNDVVRCEATYYPLRGQNTDNNS